MHAYNFVQTLTHALEVTKHAKVIGDWLKDRTCKNKKDRARFVGPIYMCLETKFEVLVVMFISNFRKGLDQGNLVAWALLWIISELHNRNVQLNNLPIENIMLHLESNENMKVGVCYWRCTSHTCKVVESLWHVKSETVKETLKTENCSVSLELFRFHNKRHHVPIKHYIKEAKNFNVGKSKRYLCNHGYIWPNTLC